jgi:hypothetical protein
MDIKCSECIKTYEINFISIETIKERIKSKDSLIEIIKFIKLELINIQLFLEFTTNSQKYSTCVNCKSNVFNQNYRMFITNLYSILLEYIETNQSQFLERTDDEDYQLKYIISKVPYNKNKYYKILFGIPYVLYEIGIPQDHYDQRKNIYFDDLIAGNPMASHGWAFESMEELKLMGVLI